MIGYKWRSCPHDHPLSELSVGTALCLAQPGDMVEIRHLLELDCIVAIVTLKRTKDLLRINKAFYNLQSLLIVSLSTMTTQNKRFVRNVAIFFMFLLEISVSAQNEPVVQQNNHLTTVTFANDQGNVNVYLPNINARQTISGTVHLQPKGKNKNKQQKNLKKLRKLSLDVGGKPVALSNDQFTLPDAEIDLDLSLVKNQRNLASTTVGIHSAIRSGAGINVPDYVVTSDIPLITGTFDGIACQDCVTLAGQPVSILAESENSLILQVPDNITGQQELVIKEGETTYEQTINVLQLDLSAERLDLLRGQQTRLTVTVEGLDGLDLDVLMELVNNSPGNITLEGGNQQLITISPEDAPSGTFQITQTVQATDNGSFSISANIVPPEQDVVQAEGPLCNCIIDSYSYLISPEACEELGGSPYSEHTDYFRTSTTNPDVTDHSARWLYYSFYSIDDDISGIEDKVEENNEAYEKVKKRKIKAERGYNNLVSIDRVLDSIPNTYKDKFKKIIDSLIRVQKNMPENVDGSALQKAVDDAKKRIDACKKRIEELEAQEEKLKEQLEKDKVELRKSVEYLKNILRDYNIKIEYEFNEDGTFSFSENDDDMFEYDKEKIKDEDEFINEIEDELKDKRERYNETLEKLKNLPDQIKDAGKDCDALEDALRKAKEAKANSDAASAVETELEELCAEIRRLLGRLWHWCANNPDYCTTSDVDKVRAQCPKTSEELERYWKSFEALVAKKKEIEEEFGEAVKEAENEMEDLDEEYENLKNAIDALEEAKQRKLQEEQDRKQRIARAKAEKDKEAAAANKQKKLKYKGPSPAPLLSEPVDPSDDQLKFQAQLLFKGLYLDELLKGKCGCTIKALALANNTNSIVKDLVGRIGVGVGFAPLEAFPGVSLGGRLGIGAIKALMSEMFGGQEFSDELAKNLFDVMGGEIFPKLVGNKFTGNRIKDLANKGLAEMLEAEGARAVQWEGKTKLEGCGEVSGKTTLFINPNTGWVTVVIKVEGCPPVVIKYKVNDDGVALSKPKPVIKEIKD